MSGPNGLLCSTRQLYIGKRDHTPKRRPHLRGPGLGPLTTMSDGVDSPGPHEVPGVSRRRILGAYYTPAHLAEAMVRWALAGGAGTVLDPSYGGCAFLDAAVNVRRQGNPDRPGGQIYGVDVDPLCVEYVSQSDGLIDANCMVTDFLAASPTDLPGSPFAAIVGNPPYVRHHWIKGGQRDSARAVAADSTVPLPGTASLWAYFLLHSLDFLAPGGRLAMLVPEAILQANYAAPLRETLAERFGRTSLIYIRERLFDGTDEPVVVVACADFGGQGDVTEEAIECVDDLEAVLADRNGRGRRTNSAGVRGRWAGTDALELLSGIESRRRVSRVAEFATVRVGLVTGANNHFIRTKHDLDALDVPQEARHPIVARTRWLRGLALDTDDHKELVENGARTLLVRPPDSADGPIVGPWIEEGLAEELDSRYKCALRDDWFRVELPPTPDAFATCTRLGSPLLVLNRGSCHCTNAIHRVQWRADLPVAAGAVAVGFLTSAVGLWAELHGRRYGGGVLKIEPGTLNRIPVPLVPGAEDCFPELDRFLRKGAEEKARALADEKVLRDGLGMTPDQVKRLRQARSRLMTQRRPSRNGNGNA